jgi:lysophospholipase L1-like esterase
MIFPSVARRRLLAAPLFLLLAAAAPNHPRPIPAAIPISRMDLPWWRVRHEEKLAELKHGPVELVFLGDSITENWERNGPEPWERFHPIWERFYGDRHAVNLGFKGDATSHLLWRIRNGELDGIRPKAVVVLIGANNLGRLHWPVADTVQGINTIVAEIRRRLPATKILLLGVLPSERSDWATESTREINAALAARYGSGGVPGVTFRDVGSLFLKGGTLDRSMFYDPLLDPPEPPLHPTAAGQERMAAAIEPTLAALLGDREHGR